MGLTARSIEQTGDVGGAWRVGTVHGVAERLGKQVCSTPLDVDEVWEIIRYAVEQSWNGHAKVGRWAANRCGQFCGMAAT